MITSILTGVTLSPTVVRSLQKEIKTAHLRAVSPVHPRASAPPRDRGISISVSLPEPNVPNDAIVAPVTPAGHANVTEKGGTAVADARPTHPTLQASHPVAVACLVAPPLLPAPALLEAEVQFAGTAHNIATPGAGIPTMGVQLTSTVYIKDDVNPQLYRYHIRYNAPLNVVSSLSSLICWLNTSPGLASQPNPKSPSNQAHCQPRQVARGMDPLH